MYRLDYMIILYCTGISNYVESYRRSVQGPSRQHNDNRTLYDDKPIRLCVHYNSDGYHTIATKFLSLSLGISTLHIEWSILSCEDWFYEFIFVFREIAK